MRIKRAVAVNAVIAWRIATLTHSARTEPKLPATTAFTEVEPALLTDFSRVWKLPPPRDLGEAFRLVATMGGYLNRKNDAPPDAEIARNGQAALSFTAWMLGHSLDAGETSELRKRLSQRGSAPDRGCMLERRISALERATDAGLNCEPNQDLAQL